MRRLCVLLAVLFACSSLLHAQESKAEIFGGYSFLRFTPPASVGDFFNLQGRNNNGWNAAATWNFNSHLGATADFGGHYGENLPGSSDLHTFLFGPKLSTGVGRATFFVHALGGAAHNTGSGFGASQTAGAYAFGGGVDWKLRSRVSLRVGQFDYIGSRFLSETQNNYRFSTGVVFHF